LVVIRTDTNTQSRDVPAFANQVAQWSQIAQTFAKPNFRQTVLRLLNTVLPLVGLWVVMALTVHGANWATLLLSVLVAAFKLRLFIVSTILDIARFSDPNA